jgi:hypothetical protein
VAPGQAFGQALRVLPELGGNVDVAVEDEAIFMKSHGAA